MFILSGATYNLESLSSLDISRGILGDIPVVGDSMLINGNETADDSGASGVMGDDEAVGLLASDSDILETIDIG